MKPILFRTDMVRAILAGTKTVTRRLIRPQFPTYQDREPGHFSKIEPYGRAAFLATHKEKPSMKTILSPPVLPGDILYVRETWGDYREHSEDGEGAYYLYRADYPDGATTYQYPEGPVCDLPKWHPSIHMPRRAARIFLRVECVRAEHLQKEFFEPICPILEVQAEGIDIGDHCRRCIDNYGEPCCVDTIDEDGSNLYGGECGMLDDPRDDFANLWDSTIKPADLSVFGWSANPWVWVISFERCEKPEDLPLWNKRTRKKT